MERCPKCGKPGIILWHAEYPWPSSWRRTFWYQRIAGKTARGCLLCGYVEESEARQRQPHIPRGVAASRNARTKSGTVFVAETQRSEFRKPRRR